MVLIKTDKFDTAFTNFKKQFQNSKPGYAQRLIIALSRIEGEITDATIIDQVEKDASEDNNPLGKPWRTFIAKETRKLVEIGVLESSDGASLDDPATASVNNIDDAQDSDDSQADMSPDDQDYARPRIKRGAPTPRGKKRGRPPKQPRHDDRDYNYEPSSSSARNPKRRRTLTITLPSMSQEVDGDSQSQERKRVQKEKGSRRHPDVDAEDEEEEELARPRYEQQERTEPLRRELAEPMDPYTDRPPAVELETRPPSSLRPSSRALDHPPPPNAARTPSGSYISPLSRHPTPPRSPGTTPDTLTECGRVETEGGRLVTQEGHVEDPSSQIQSDIDPLSRTNDKTLEGTLTSRGAEVQSLEAQLSEIQGDFAAVQAKLFERDQQISNLSANFALLKNEASRKAADIERYTKRIRLLEASRGNEKDLSERDLAIKTLSADRQQLLADLDLLRTAVNILKRDKMTLSSRLTESESQAQKLRSEMATYKEVTDGDLRVLRSTNNELEGKVETYFASIAALNQEVHGLQESQCSTNASLVTLRDEHALALNQIRDAAAVRESLMARISSALDDEFLLKGQLEDAKRQVATLSQSVAQSDGNNERLARSLSLAEMELSTLRQELVSQEATIAVLQSGLGISRACVDELEGKLATTENERIEHLTNLEKARKDVSLWTSSATQLEERLAMTTKSLAEVECTVAELQANLSAATDKFTAEEGRNRDLVSEVGQKDAEIIGLGQLVSTAETVAKDLRAALATSQSAAQELQSRLSDAENELTAAKTTHTLAVEDKNTRIQVLEALVEAGRCEINKFDLRLSSAHSEKKDLDTRMETQNQELAELKAKLLAESQRSSRFEADLNSATAKLQEADEELLELRDSKAEDELTIKNLKNVISTHVKTQTQSLAALDSQGVSAKSSPAPKRRSIRTTKKDPPVPFMLT